MSIDHLPIGQGSPYQTLRVSSDVSSSLGQDEFPYPLKHPEAIAPILLTFQKYCPLSIRKDLKLRTRKQANPIDGDTQ